MNKTFEDVTYCSAQGYFDRHVSQFSFWHFINFMNLFIEKKESIAKINFSTSDNIKVGSGEYGFIQFGLTYSMRGTQNISEHHDDYVICEFTYMILSYYWKTSLLKL